MRMIWYVLVVVLGAVGMLSILRVGERMVFGGGGSPPWVQMLIGILCLFGAWQALKRTRAK